MAIIWKGLGGNVLMGMNDGGGGRREGQEILKGEENRFDGLWSGWNKGASAD